MPATYPHFPDFAAAPEQLLSVPEVATELGLSRISAALLAVSGLGGPAYRLEGRSSILSALTPASAIRELQAYTPLAGVPHEEAFVVRVRPARKAPPEDDRPLVGWMPMWQWSQSPYVESHQGVDPDAGYHADMDRAVGRWWAAADPESWVGKPLVATVAGYVCYCARITGFSHHEDSSNIGFDLSRDAAIAGTFTRRFMPPIPGGNVIHLPANSPRA